MTAQAPSQADHGLRQVAVPVATMWTSPSAPRDVDLPALADVPDVAGWTTSLETPARKDLNGRTLTQLLMGERVRVLAERDGWRHVVALDQASSAHPEGYPGWVRAAHLDSPTPDAVTRRVVVVSRIAPCPTDDGTVLDLSFGTRLGVVALSGGHANVLLPGGRRGRVSLSDARVVDDPSVPSPSPDEVLDAAAGFLGLRYLWGGTCAWGLDCSGLVHLVLRTLGVDVPRDAFDQAAAVQPVALSEVRPGDLYFFARPGADIYHVGFASRPVGADGVRWMLHAPEGGELVEDAPMAPHRAGTLVSAGRLPVRA